MGLLLHMQKLDDMDQSAWERIEEQEGAGSELAHETRSFRKKFPPDVRDDPMEGPAQRNMSLCTGRNYIMEKHT